MRSSSTEAATRMTADAPKSVAHVLALVKRNFYNGQRISRVAPGFVGQSATIAAGVWRFAPSVILQANTQYFFYSNVALSVSVTTRYVNATSSASSFSPSCQ